MMQLVRGTSSQSLIHLLNDLSKVDDQVLRYLDDDGTLLNQTGGPNHSMILINGSKGIGTGFSCDIPPFNPTQIIQYLKAKIEGKDASGIEIEPYYKGFKGTITKIAEQKYLIKGRCTITDSKTVKITELPIGTWTDDYKEFLEKLTMEMVKEIGLSRNMLICTISCRH